MIPEITEPAQVLAPIVALVVAYVLFYEGFIYKLGRDGEAFATIRSVLPMLDEEAREVGFYTSYTVKKSEFVGLLDTVFASMMAVVGGQSSHQKPDTHEPLSDSRRQQRTTKMSLTNPDYTHLVSLLLNGSE